MKKINHGSKDINRGFNQKITVSKAKEFKKIKPFLDNTMKHKLKKASSAFNMDFNGIGSKT